MDLSPNQLVAAAYDETGAFGIGQTPRATDLAAGLQRLGLMLAEWQQHKYLVFQQVERLAPVVAGQPSYSVGDGGDFDTGPGSLRPVRLESAWYRLYQQGVPQGIGTDQIGEFAIGFVSSAQAPIDYPLEILKSREDYSALRQKQLGAFPEGVYYDPGLPLGSFIPWPLPVSGQASVFGITVLAQLPRNFAAQADQTFSLPDVYYSALTLNLGLRLCSRMRVPPPPLLPLQAKQALATLRGTGFSVPLLQMPVGIARGPSYNIYGDT